MLIFWKNVDLDRFGLNQSCKANGFNGSLKVPFCCQSSLVAQRSKEYGAHKDHKGGPHCHVLILQSPCLRARIVVG